MIEPSHLLVVSYPLKHNQNEYEKLLDRLSNLPYSIGENNYRDGILELSFFLKRKKCNVVGTTWPVFVSLVWLLIMIVFLKSTFLKESDIFIGLSIEYWWVAFAPPCACHYFCNDNTLCIFTKVLYKITNTIIINM